MKAFLHIALALIFATAIPGCQIAEENKPGEEEEILPPFTPNGSGYIKFDGVQYPLEYAYVQTIACESPVGLYNHRLWLVKINNREYENNENRVFADLYSYDEGFSGTFLPGYDPITGFDHCYERAKLVFNYSGGVNINPFIEDVECGRVSEDFEADHPHLAVGQSGWSVSKAADTFTFNLVLTGGLSGKKAEIYFRGIPEYDLIK